MELWMEPFDPKVDGISPELDRFVIPSEWVEFYADIKEGDYQLRFRDSYRYRYELELESGRHILISALDFDGYGITLFELCLEVGDKETVTEDIEAKLLAERWLKRSDGRYELFLNLRGAYLGMDSQINKWTAVRSALELLKAKPQGAFKSDFKLRQLD